MNVQQKRKKEILFIFVSAANSVPLRHRQNVPPVLVELSVTKAEQLSGEVQRRVEEPIEKHQPEQMVWNLEEATA